MVLTGDFDCQFDKPGSQKCCLKATQALQSMILEGGVQRQNQRLSCQAGRECGPCGRGRSMDGVGEAPPSSSSRTVPGKLLELEGNSQHSWSELLPTPPTPSLEPAKLLLVVFGPSSTVSNGPPRPALLCLINLSHEVSCGSSTTPATSPTARRGRWGEFASAGAGKGGAM